MFKPISVKTTVLSFPPTSVVTVKAQHSSEHNNMDYIPSTPKPSKSFASRQTSLTPSILYTPTMTKEIYIGTDGFGLKCYNTRTQKISSISLEYPFLNPEKLKIHAIFRDKNGSLWLGIYQKGVLMVPRQEQKFNYIGSKSYEKESHRKQCYLCLSPR